MDEATRMIAAGRATSPEPMAVNSAIVRTSTVLYPDLATMRDHRQRRETGERLFTYGARGTPTAFKLEDAFCELEQGERAFLYPSGLFALAAILLAFTEPGDHVAIIDSVYPPVRAMAERYFRNALLSQPWSELYVLRSRYHFIPGGAEAEYPASTC